METTDNAIDRGNMDMGVSPGTNFYQYANGGWMERNPIPEEFSRYGSFDILSEENVEMVKDLIEEASREKNPMGSAARKVGDFYALGMDSAKIEKEAMNPIRNELEKIDAIEDTEGVLANISGMHRRYSLPLFNVFSAPDRMNSDLVILYLFQGGLGMADRDYYTNPEERYREIREKYIEYVAEMFELTGESSEFSREAANRIMKLETRLAEASMTRLELRDPRKTYNKMELNDLAALAPGIDWEAYFKAIGLPDPGGMNVAQPAFFAEAGKMLTELPPEDWKLYLKWNVINSSAVYLSSDFVNRNFDFYSAFLQGSEKIRPRWKRVVASTNSALGEVVGQLFVEKHFPPEAKERMLELVGNLKYALAGRIGNLDWMGPETKKEALAKLEAMNVKIGYPDKWKDYSSLEVGNLSYLDNVVKGRIFGFNEMIAKVGKPVDPVEWGMTPQTVNAYYSPSRNEIVFPAAILQPPFFYLDADDAVNYGAIGVVIGHEMTHGFDDKGRQYDKAGNLTDWWTKEDSERFMQRANVLVEQFNAFTVFDTVKANGELTLGENIADLGGLSVAYDAFMKAKAEIGDPGLINAFTPEQRFYLSYAHIWAQNIRDKEILRRTKEDVHSLGKFRVNGPLPNIREFHQAFNLSEGDPMYYLPDKRAIIW